MFYVDLIPDELKTIPNFVLYRNGSEDDKKPIQADLFPERELGAKADNVETWASYSVVQRLYDRFSSRIGGFGFELGLVQSPSGFVCIDIDHCLDDNRQLQDVVKNGKTILTVPEIEEILNKFDSYTEVSPGGYGLHIWIKGKKTFQLCEQRGIEVYSCKRYIRLSGDIFNTDYGETVNDRQDSLDWLGEKYFDLGKKYNEIVPTNTDTTEIEKALKHIDVTMLSYSSWLFVGTFLKKNGCSCSVWDDWSRQDVARYKSDDCTRRWENLGNNPAFVVNENAFWYLASQGGYVVIEEKTKDKLTDISYMVDWFDDLPPLAPELICGVLRQGHKMLISGPSKAGKTFLLMELASSLATGKDWLGFNCIKTKVLYINLELDSRSCKHRLKLIWDKLSYSREDSSNLIVWNLRGAATMLDVLVPVLIEKMKDVQGLGAVIIDPIYKVLTGDENNASDMAKFCNQFDKICEQLGCSTIYCHHHSKGSQGGKKAMDRASGSGVFARDPDAQLDLIQLHWDEDDTPDYINNSFATAWRIEFTLREFAPPKPISIWFRHPLHILDENGFLINAKADGEKDQQSKEDKDKRTFTELWNAFEYCSSDGKTATRKELAKFVKKDEKTVRRWITEIRICSEYFMDERGKITKIKE